MPDFNPGLQRGREAVIAAAERNSDSGDFKPFCPEIKWMDTGEKGGKYLLFLTPIDDDDPNSVFTGWVHEWVKVGTFTRRDGEVKDKYEWFLHRAKNAAIGESYDELEERLGNDAHERTIGVAVELEPTFEPGRGGKERVSGFKVKTREYVRKGDDDELETVTQPEIGVVSQAASNFWNYLDTYNQVKDPVTETPMQVVRTGKKADTSYNFFDFPGQPVDFENLLAYIEGLSYLTEDKGFKDMLVEADAADTDLEAAQVIAHFLLNRRLSELADKERYNALVKPIKELEQRFPKDKKSNNDKPDKRAPARKRPTRREALAAAQAEQDAKEPKASKPEPEAAPAEDKPDRSRFNRLRQRAEA